MISRSLASVHIEVSNERVLCYIAIATISGRPILLPIFLILGSSSLRLLQQHAPICNLALPHEAQDNINNDKGEN